MRTAWSGIEGTGPGAKQSLIAGSSAVTGGNRTFEPRVRRRGRAKSLGLVQNDRFRLIRAREGVNSIGDLMQSIIDDSEFDLDQGALRPRVIAAEGGRRRALTNDVDDGNANIIPDWGFPLLQWSKHQPRLVISQYVIPNARTTAAVP